jgi:hypothetical protein
MKLGLLLVVTALMLGETASAQDYSTYFTTYYSNANTANAPDASVRIINDGNTGFNLYANIYVFDDSEELQECCSCAITPDGILSESVNKNLTANPLTGVLPKRGVIKVITNDVSGAAVGIPPPLGGLHGWATHIQGTKVTLSPGNQVVPVVAGPYFVTETPFADSNLSPSEQGMLYQLCYFDWLLSGNPCTCQPEDDDF